MGSKMNSYSLVRSKIHYSFERVFTKGNTKKNQ